MNPVFEQINDWGDRNSFLYQQIDSSGVHARMPATVSQVIVNDKICDLNKLSMVERNIFVMRLILGISLKSTAEMLSLTTVSVGQLLDSAQKKLDIKR